MESQLLLPASPELEDVLQVTADLPDGVHLWRLTDWMFQYVPAPAVAELGAVELVVRIDTGQVTECRQGKRISLDADGHKWQRDLFQEQIDDDSRPVSAAPQLREAEPGDAPADSPKHRCGDVQAAEGCPDLHSGQRPLGRDLANDP